jgi:pimeloyl-ACP methyl ester carboxylesterase
MKNLFYYLLLSFISIYSSSIFSQVDEHPCGDFKQEIPKDWFQGTVDSLENPDNEGDRKLKIFYYGKIQKDKTPVVFFNGGPGQRSHDAFYLLTKAQKIFDPKASISFVFIDQRGTGCSDFYPQGSSDEVLERLMYYGSRGIVADAEAVRKKILGNKPWIIFGQSYGAHIVHKYVTLYPSSIKAAFAHGNTLNSSAFDRFKFRIASQVRVLDEYVRQYPEDGELINFLTDNLTLNDCYNYGKLKNIQACGREVSEDLVSSFLGNSGNWPKMHLWLASMTDGKVLKHDNIANYVENFFEEQSEKYSKKWADRVISWVDRNTAPYDRRNCSAIAYELFLEDVDVTNNGFTECASILQNPDSNMDNWGRKMVKFLPQDILTIKDFKQSLLDNKSLPFYLYSGQKDPFVPVESFREELNAVENLPNFRYKNFPGTGHDGYMNEAQVWQELIKEVLR